MARLLRHLGSPFLFEELAVYLSTLIPVCVLVVFKTILKSLLQNLMSVNTFHMLRDCGR